MRIALDAMGGDHAPAATVEGAVAAAQESSHEVILVGNGSLIRAELARLKVKNPALSVCNATETIEMDESPAQAVRQKKDSSLAVAANLVAEGKADAFVSAGNSGAAMASALLYLGRIPGVSRPAIATLFPTINGVCLLLDVGANVDCKPKHLQQFGLMGSIFMESVFGINEPRVGLLSIGEEDSKGNELTLAAFDLLRNAPLNFAGNIEGRDICAAKSDVVVCDGFVGNIVLKFGEGVAEMMLRLVKEEFKAHPISWASLPFLWAALKDLRKKVDYTEHGGAPLLGVNGACIISHGRSNAKAIKNAIFASARFAERNVNKAIAESITRLEDPSTAPLTE